jgi:hypothetical protein
MVRHQRRQLSAYSALRGTDCGIYGGDERDFRYPWTVVWREVWLEGSRCGVLGKGFDDFGRLSSRCGLGWFFACERLREFGRPPRGLVIDG